MGRLTFSALALDAEVGELEQGWAVFACSWISKVRTSGGWSEGQVVGQPGAGHSISAILSRIMVTSVVGLW